MDGTMTGIQPTYNLADRGFDGFGGGSGMWFALLLLFALGGTGFGFGGRSNVATTDELSAGFNFSGINNKLNELTAGQANINQNLGNAICSSTYELGSKIDNCCCTTQRAIDSVKFDLANYFAGVNANVTAQVQSVKDLFYAQESKAKDARIAQLELNQALCGVVRYPTSMAYASPCNPFATYSGCGCTNI